MKVPKRPVYGVARYTASMRYSTSATTSSHFPRAISKNDPSENDLEKKRELRHNQPAQRKVILLLSVHVRRFNVHRRFKTH